MATLADMTPAPRHSAPHPLHEAEPARAARIAEGVHRASSAQLLTVASQIARALVEAAVLAAFFVNVAIWADVLSVRL